MEISYNVLNNFDVGIQFWGHNANAYDYVDVSYNKLNDADDLTYVNNIGISFSYTYVVRKVNINNNIISNCITGIVGSNFQTDCSVISNFIRVPANIPAGRYVGIDLYGCQKTICSFNEVVRVSDNPSVAVIGMRGTNLSYGNMIKSNSFFDSEITQMRGVHLYGNCVGVQMECNYFSHCDEAMYLGGLTQQVAMSNQGSGTVATENDWYPYDNTYQYRVHANTNQIDWYFDDDAGLNYSNGKWPETNSQNIFLNGFNFTGSLCEDPAEFHAEGERDFDPIIDETISFADNYEEHLYNLKSGLFQAFLHKEGIDTLIMNNGSYADWFENLYEENLGKLERAEYLIFGTGGKEAAEEAHGLFSGVTPDNLIEENKLFMLNILYNNIMAENYIHNLDSMEAEDVALVTDLANENSIESGEAVIWARIMLRLYIDDEEIIALRKRSNMPKHQTSDLQLYPNPSNGIIHVVSDLGSCTIEIYTLQGVLLKKFENVKRNQPVLLELECGMYVYKLYSSDGESSQSGLMSIVK